MREIRLWDVWVKEKFSDCKWQGSSPYIICLRNILICDFRIHTTRSFNKRIKFIIIEKILDGYDIDLNNGFLFLFFFWLLKWHESFLRGYPGQL